jgi:hypothetical protein
LFPAAAAAASAAIAVTDGNFQNGVEEANYFTNTVKMADDCGSKLDWEVSFMLFLILKQLEEVAK